MSNRNLTPEAAANYLLVEAGAGNLPAYASFTSQDPEQMQEGWQIWRTDVGDLSALVAVLRLAARDGARGVKLDQRGILYVAIALEI